MSTSDTSKPAIEDFLKPLSIDVATAHALARDLHQVFLKLSAESATQFLPTPISESILRPTAGREKGRYLAIDIGGTNLRAGFIELLGSENAPTTDRLEVHQEAKDTLHASNIHRALEKSWSISENLKNDNPESLFAWIGRCIAEVVREGCEIFDLPRDVELPMGVTFSFPMVQRTLSEATLMPMGKGFAFRSGIDIGKLLTKGYEKARNADLPRIKVAAILNDAVATLVAFIYESKEDDTHKASMGFICGTGSNATIPIRRKDLSYEKRPNKIKVLAGEPLQDVKIAVNTEWSINGSAPALHRYGLVSKWDTKLDSEGEIPGFQPLEYMTAGRYLGELGRLMMLDYLKARYDLDEQILPEKLRHRFGLTTTFLSHFKPIDQASILLGMLEAEFPRSTAGSSFEWTEDMASSLSRIAKTIEVRAAGIIAAAVIGLLACGGDVPLRDSLQDDGTKRPGQANGNRDTMNLIVGYTGGCITHFQDYLADCQIFLDAIITAEFGPDAPVRVTLSPCHDGGIKGAGVLCGASQVNKDNSSPKWL
ncbi:hexokinase-7 [Xylariomycetidae sp. FL2044]|nr:hexokinase-7 [Xylariomycetidae sp. FL2044]